MSKNVLIAVTLSFVLCVSTGGAALAELFGPGPWFGRIWAYGNDTGGIIPYSPDVKLVDYREMAASYCAHWRRLSHVTSVHRRYGDYVAFVCIDRPGMIH
jgi:hypothetical protein